MFAYVYMCVFVFAYDGDLTACFNAHVPLARQYIYTYLRIFALARRTFALKITFDYISNMFATLFNALVILHSFLLLSGMLYLASFLKLLLRFGACVGFAAVCC